MIVRPSHSPAAPSWVHDAVFYQVFPDRFANGDPSLDPEGVVPWDSEPTRGNFFGGDLAGIEARLDHIQRLGANALYLTPIFEADTNHRYDTADYFRIDHRLGDRTAFRSLLTAAHTRGMRVVLDAVFNHCGEGHWAFRHVHAHGAESPYVNWFLVDGFPIVRDPEPNYATCMGCKYLPQFNHRNPEVREYLYSVAEHWIEEGIDGWRLDVPFLINHEFWRGFRERVKARDPELYIVAEIWEEATEWLAGDTADASMNYPLREAILDFAGGTTDSAAFADRLSALYAVTPDWARTSMLNLLGSHDTVRLRSRLAGDPDAERIAVALQLTSPGAPMVYYGDEVGLQGGDDPGCRAAMPWDESVWDADLFEWHRRLIELRRRHPALRGFDDEIVHAQGEVMVRRRTGGGETAFVVINRGSVDANVPASLLGEARLDVLEGLPVSTLGDRVNVPARGVLVLVP